MSLEFKQQKHKYSCGQACVAMLAKRDEDWIIKNFFNNHNGCTKTNDIIVALNDFGFDNSGKLLRLCKSRSLPTVGILKVLFPDHKKHEWHWVLKFGKYFYDPCNKHKYRKLRNDAKIISFIQVYN